MSDAGKGEAGGVPMSVTGTGEFQPGMAPAVDFLREMVSTNVDTFLHECNYQGYSRAWTR